MKHYYRVVLSSLLVSASLLTACRGKDSPVEALSTAYPTEQGWSTICLGEFLYKTHYIPDGESFISLNNGTVYRTQSEVYEEMKVVFVDETHEGVTVGLYSFVVEGGNDYRMPLGQWSQVWVTNGEASIVTSDFESILCPITPSRTDF